MGKLEASASNKLKNRSKKLRCSAISDGYDTRKKRNIFNSGYTFNATRKHDDHHHHHVDHDDDIDNTVTVANSNDSHYESGYHFHNNIQNTDIRVQPKHSRKSKRLLCLRLDDSDVVEGWDRIREDKGFSADEEVAKFLLEWYFVDTKSMAHMECVTCQSPLTVFCEKCNNFPTVHKPFSGIDESSTISVKKRGRYSSSAEGYSFLQSKNKPASFITGTAVKVDSSNHGNVFNSFDRDVDSSAFHEKSDDDLDESDYKVNLSDGDNRKNVEKSEEKGYCPYCSLEFSKEKYCSHMATHKDLIVVEENNKTQCKSCSKKFKSFKDACSHIRIAAHQSECSECSQTVHFSCQLREHQRLHRREVLQYCKWCQKPMIELAYIAFQKHLKEHREDEKKAGGKQNKNLNSKMCALCGKVFRDMTYLELHINSVHSDKRPFACTWPGCTHTSKTKRDLRDHVVFHGEKHEVCEQCGQKFHRVVELKLHMQDHFGKKFECEKCNRRFKKQFDLKEHFKTVHMGLRRFTCTSCYKKFPTKWAMHKHVEAVHLRIRPFKCPDCDLSSKTKQALQKHMLRHTRHKPYQCTDCGQAFSCSSSFKKHRLAKHKDHFYVCKVCGLGFPVPQSLNFHMRMCHNEVSVSEDVLASSIIKDHHVISMAEERMTSDFLSEANDFVN